MEFTDLHRELEEVRKIINNMDNCYGAPVSVKEDKVAVNIKLEKRNLPMIKTQGKYLGSTTRIYQRDIDNEKKLIEEHMEIERDMKIRKLESDIRMEILLTKLELKKKGLI